MHPYPLLLARRHPGAPPVLAGNTLPLTSHRRVDGERATGGPACSLRVVTTPAHARCTRVAVGRFAPVGCSLRPVSAQYCATVFKCFSIVLNSRNCFKLQKFVETCRNIQNLQNKFCMNPLEPLLTVGLTKLTFTRSILVQNSKNSKIILIVHKYLCLQIMRNFACMFISSPVAHKKVL
jgi:hypothetical protein